MGWLHGWKWNGFYQQTKGILWPHYGPLAWGMAIYRGGHTPMMRRGKAAPYINRSHRSSSPSHGDPVLNTVIVLKMWKTPIIIFKKNFMKKLKNLQIQYYRKRKTIFLLCTVFSNLFYHLKN